MFQWCNTFALNSWWLLSWSRLQIYSAVNYTLLSSCTQKFKNLGSSGFWNVEEAEQPPVICHWLKKKSYTYSWFSRDSFLVVQMCYIHVHSYFKPLLLDAKYARRKIIWPFLMSSSNCPFPTMSFLCSFQVNMAKGTGGQLSCCIYTWCSWLLCMINVTMLLNVINDKEK